MNVLFVSPRITNDFEKIVVEFALESYTNKCEHIIFRVESVTKKQSQLYLDYNTANESANESANNIASSYFSAQQILYVGIFPISGGYTGFTTTFAPTMSFSDIGENIQFSFYVNENCFFRSIFSITKDATMLPYIGQ